ncbi:MAG: hypothetical protein ABSH01_04640 [Terriglobia bacterium]|jgi:hypothetical protein
MKKTLSLLALGVLLCGAVQAKAETITYTVQDTVSGTLDSNSFFDALVTVAFTGDTANVWGGAIFWEIDVGTATVDIAGIGAATFTDAMFAFDNPSGAAGIGDNICSGCGGSVLDTFNSAFGSYDLMSAIGPLSGDVYFRPDLSYGTTAGLLNFSSAGYQQVSHFLLYRLRKNSSRLSF